MKTTKASWLQAVCQSHAAQVYGRDNRPYLGRSALPHEIARTLPVLDVNQLSPERLAAAITVYEDLKGTPLQGFSSIESDAVRCQLNTRLCRKVLGIESAVVDELTRKLALEPTMHARH